MTTPSPLHLPLRGASPVAAVGRYFRKGLDFTGRASSSEYWWVVLFNLLLATIFIPLGWAVHNTYGSNPIPTAILICGLATLIPYLALLVRRLHDANISGNWAYLTFLGILGAVVLMVMASAPSSPWGCRFDRGYRPPDPSYAPTS
jgi:uncharacterized membrane protein YhaH (DUF805 family)